MIVVSALHCHFVERVLIQIKMWYYLWIRPIGTIPPTRTVVIICPLTGCFQRPTCRNTRVRRTRNVWMWNGHTFLYTVYYLRPNLNQSLSIDGALGMITNRDVSVAVSLGIMYVEVYMYSISHEICTRFCCALLCCGYAIVHNEFTWSIYPYSPGLFCWHWGNR